MLCFCYLLMRQLLAHSCKEQSGFTETLNLICAGGKFTDPAPALILYSGFISCSLLVRGEEERRPSLTLESWFGVSFTDPLCHVMTLAIGNVFSNDSLSGGKKEDLYNSLTIRSRDKNVNNINNSDNMSNVQGQNIPHLMKGPVLQHHGYGFPAERWAPMHILYIAMKECFCGKSMIYLQEQRHFCPLAVIGIATQYHQVNGLCFRGKLRPRFSNLIQVAVPSRQPFIKSRSSC